MADKISGRQAFDIAYEKFTDTVYRVACHNTVTFADAEDITQDVFMKLIEKKRSFESEEHLKAWLIRVTLNLCRNLNRKSGRISVLDENIPTEDKDTDILLCVKSLPENYRNAIYLHYYEGYTAAEIAEITGGKQNTVLSYLSRGREMLKKQLSGGFDDE